MHPAVEFVKEVGGAREFRLKSNGLRILIYPYAPLQGGAVVMMHCNVGSRNEGVGYTGSTHCLEHLLFKGSENFPQGTMSIDKAFGRVGAPNNASTWLDRTNYYAVVANEDLDLAMRVWADCMRNATFTDQDRADEMTVVRNELEMSENDPAKALEGLVCATAIYQHPYHHPTIGWRSDVEGVGIERIRQFYDDFYHPNNAMLIVVGDAAEDEILRKAHLHFSGISASIRPIPAMYTTEPEQRGERRVILEQTSSAEGIVKLAWRTPEAAHPDIPALVALSWILSGGRASVLDSKLVTPGLIRSVTMSVDRFHDPSLTSIVVGLLGAQGHSKVERRVRQIVKTVQKRGLRDKDLERAKIMFDANTWRLRDGCVGIAESLSTFEGAGAWDLHFRIPAELHRVTIDDVMRVLRDYFRDDALTVGWFVPLPAKGGRE